MKLPFNSLQAIAALLPAVAILFFAISHPASSLTPNWFGNTRPNTTQISVYEGDPPPSTRLDCNELTLVSGDYACVTETSLGDLTLDSNLVVGGKKYRLTNQFRQGLISHIPNTLSYVETSYVSGGAYIRFFDSLSRKDVTKKFYSGLPTVVEYSINKPSERGIVDSQGTALKTSGGPLAYSSNGEWIVVDIPYAGLFRVNLISGELTPFALSQTQLASKYTPVDSFAITNDGQRVVASGLNDMFIFDLSTCTQHSFVAGTQPNINDCKTKNIWKGINATGQKVDEGMQASYLNSRIWGNTRFVDNENIRFDVQYRNSANEPYITASLIATAPGASLHKLGLLGMGDSYISGEGIGRYISGTDTNDNKCHLSNESYPYILGAQHFNSYQSVACAGAVIDDVQGLNEEYAGQTKTKVPLRARNPDLGRILDMFSAGYAQQENFAKHYIPQAAVLSVMGNDIGFDDMIVSCVTSLSDPCYRTYEDRKEKTIEISKQFNPLVKTYKALSNKGMTKLYVVGYPQVAKTNGDCALNVRLNNEEIEFSNLLVSYMNQTIENAAKKAGVRYVDIERSLHGHRLCEAKTNTLAMNGLTLGNDKGLYIPFLNVQLGPIENSSYHPNKLGHRLIYSSIAQSTNGLTQSMPKADSSIGPPQISDTMPLLKEAPHSGKTIDPIKTHELTDGTLIRGKQAPISVDGLAADTLPDSTYRVELHSTPTVLGLVGSDANGDISTTIQIPPSIEPGFHSINLYGLDFAGQPMTLQKIVYVAANENDYDGDGIENSLDPCMIVQPTSLDIDQDGIDDGCDALIDEAPSADQPTSAAGASNKAVLLSQTISGIFISQGNTLNPQGTENKNGQLTSITEPDHQVLGDNTTQPKSPVGQKSSTKKYMLLVGVSAVVLTAVLITKTVRTRFN